MENKTRRMDFSFEKRRSGRAPFGILPASVTCNGSNLAGAVENISENGLHLIAASKKLESTLVPESIIEMRVKLPQEKQVSLHGEVRWVHINRTPIHGLTYRMGIELMKESPGYKDYLSILK